MLFPYRFIITEAEMTQVYRHKFKLRASLSKNNDTQGLFNGTQEDNDNFWISWDKIILEIS